MKDRKLATRYAKALLGALPDAAGQNLADEFLTALEQGRDPFPNAMQSANWTCVGILAHQSAMAGGAVQKLPEFTLKPTP